MNQAIRKLSALIQTLTKPDGQDLVEYALLVALIALAATAGMRTLALEINAAFLVIAVKLGLYVLL